ncbi:vacuolar protein sorting/targeting protein 10 [Phlegmacium glaucopus]|nr:vacuolar protein sorting/targeting protein 10 [Phlegmacium glaucopus]
MTAARCWALLSWLSFIAVFVAAQSKPESIITPFNNLPERLFFFDDTDVALFHDLAERNVYMSHDEGRNWKQADGIPDGVASIVVEHPFDNRYAFILTQGMRHYRTEDRGRTWRPFEVPVPPAEVAKPLTFHSDLKKYGYILYQGRSCEGEGWQTRCRVHTYYTKTAFSDETKILLTDTTNCQFAHSTKDFIHDAHPDHIYCVSFDTSETHTISSSRLYSSTDFFEENIKIEEFGIGRKAKGVVAFAIVSKFAVAALKDLSGRDGDMLLFVSVDAKTWAKAQFPHASSAQLRENAYTLLESTTHSLAVDVVLQDRAAIGTLFISNSNGTFFVETLKDTNRNRFGFVDYERIYGVEGIGMSNIVTNAQEVEGRGVPKKLRTMITFSDGSSWAPIRPPSQDISGQKISCDPSDTAHCALHFHSVTAAHNYGRIFSSPAPGFVMGVGSVGESLWEYGNSDTFLSTDAGVTWKMISKDAHKYEFGDLGSILVIVNDEEPTDIVKYSLDLGTTWTPYDLGVKLRAYALVTLPDSTSQKFLLLGQVSKGDQKYGDGGAVVVFLDFSKTRGRKCQDSDFEKWYARPHESECLMGHRQWYKRRKPEANCYVGEKYRDPVTHEDNCPCTDADYECDFNFIRQGSDCVPVGPEPIPAGICNPETPDQMYKGSSGWRKVPGNTCEGGIQKDEKVDKKCSNAQPPEGNVVHQTFQFQTEVVQHAYFKEDKTILVRLSDFSMWQSSNEGYSWTQLFPEKRFLAFYHHKYAVDRAFLITDSDTFYYTTDTGRTWNIGTAPSPPNSFGIQVIHFHPTSDLLIWTGNRDCNSDTKDNCHVEAHYSDNNGRHWQFVESYVRNCAFAKDARLEADPTEIVCESYKDKQGSQTYFGKNPLELVVGRNYFEKSSKRRLFENVVGFTKFSEFFVVAEVLPSRGTLELQVSLDGNRFASGKFPPSMHPETHAYTILESSTYALFLLMTMSEPPYPYWGTILKSNSNGTYFGISAENVNRNERGYVDFEKMIGLDGIALINIVANPEEAKIIKSKILQSRITHNDGSTWTPLTPPLLDSNKQPYSCFDTSCSLHIHGYTERNDPRATYSTPSVPGLLMAVGNVGEYLAPYTDSDTFLSRDAGFTWQEVHKDAHLWEFGDSGSIVVMANDEEPTDHVLYSTDEGLTWREYQFTQERMRVKSIVTVPSDTSRKFILFGDYHRSLGSIAVHLDFSALTSRQCNIDAENPGKDDFELWSPSEERPEQCLFGRQTLYHRRVRSADCVVGDKQKAANKVIQNCPCARADFECEFNYVKNSNDECVLVPGTTPLPDEQSCAGGEEFWYERTPYRLIPYSSCENGDRSDRGKPHRCPGFGSKGPVFWFFVLLLPFGFTALVAYFYFRRSGLARGTIRLPGEVNRLPAFGGDTGVIATLASIPWFIVGVTGIAYQWVASRVDMYFFRSQRTGYRHVPIDEDAQILRFEDEEP